MYSFSNIDETPPAFVAERSWQIKSVKPVLVNSSLERTPGTQINLYYQFFATFAQILGVLCV